MGFGFDFIFAVFPILFIIMFVFVFGLIIVQFAKAAKQKQRDDRSPVLTVDAKIVAKRTDVKRIVNGENNVGRHISTYYATFEFESGDRLELLIPSEEYGYLVEGDPGKLTFQGSRFILFDR